MLKFKSFLIEKNELLFPKLLVRFGSRKGAAEIVEERSWDDRAAWTAYLIQRLES